MTSPVLKGSTPFYGLDIGIVLLDATFPRPPGDVAHASTFLFPVLYEVVAGASPQHVVEEAAAGLLDSFVAAVQRLHAQGVAGIATCCGFLAIYQRKLAAAVPVPVATSSLLQIPQVLRVLGPGYKVGVLTTNGSTLSDRHFDGVGISQEERGQLVILGLERTRHLYPVIIGGRHELDVARACEEVVQVAKDAVANDPKIAAFVFECTNLPPYAAAVQSATGRPVFDAVTLVNWMHSAVRASTYR